MYVGAVVPNSKKVQGSDLMADWGISVWSLFGFPVLAGLPLGCSGFLLLSKDMKMISNGYSKLHIGVFVSVNKCSS